MTQKDKKPKGKRVTTAEHRTVKIAEIIKLEYIVKMICWCGNSVVIDSTRSITENICSNCKSPIKLLKDEWTIEEQEKFMKSRNV